MIPKFLMIPKLMIHSPVRTVLLKQKEGHKL